MIFSQPASRSAHDQYSPTTHCIVPDLEKPIRAELFGVERLKPHADSLAAAQVAFSEPRLFPLLTSRVLGNGRALLESYRIIARAIQQEHVICCCPMRFHVSFFMNKFRKPGFIDYNRELHVHSFLLNIVLHD
jgi:hypothetical protein